MGYDFFSKVHWMTITQHPHIYVILASNLFFEISFFQHVYQFPPYLEVVGKNNPHSHVDERYEGCDRGGHDHGGGHITPVDACV